MGWNLKMLAVCSMKRCQLLVFLKKEKKPSKQNPTKKPHQTDNTLHGVF